MALTESKRLINLPFALSRSLGERQILGGDTASVHSWFSRLTKNRFLKHAPFVSRLFVGIR